ncbi:MAG: hypothetical protein ACEPO8_07530 [Rhodothermaceae bacterium]
MKQNIKNIVNLVLGFILFSHITLIHNFEQNYIICSEDNGRVHIEEIGNSHCHNATDLFSNLISNKDCEDENIDENCFEENQLLTKNNIISKLIKVKNNISGILPAVDNKTKNSFDIIPQVNNTLENYSTVLLLI